MSLVRFILWHRRYRWLVPICWVFSAVLAVAADPCRDGAFLSEYAVILPMVVTVGVWAHLSTIRARLYEREIREGAIAGKGSEEAIWEAINAIRKEPWLHW